LKVKTHYDNLQVARNASAEVIRAAYKSLAHRYHPDRNVDDRERSERIMRLINEAHATLSDPRKRAEHDAWIASEEASGSASFDDAHMRTDRSRPASGATADYGEAADVWRASRRTLGPESARTSTGERSSASTPEQGRQTTSGSDSMSASTGLGIAVAVVVAVLASMHWWGIDARKAFYGVGIFAGLIGVFAIVQHIRKLHARGNEAAAGEELGLLLTLLAWGWMPLVSKAGAHGNVLTADTLAMLFGAYWPAQAAARALLNRSARDLRWIEVSGYLLLMTAIFAATRLFLASPNSLSPLSGNNLSHISPDTIGIVTLGAVLWAAFLFAVAGASTFVLAAVGRLRGQPTTRPRAVGLLVSWATMPIIILLALVS
jgi:hypothetical protein